MDTQQEFLFDDFFASDTDPGVEVLVRIRGRSVPIRVRRGLSLADTAECELAAMKTHIDPLKGVVVADGIDSRKLMEEMLIRSIVSWPFTTRDGSPVPLTRENVMKLLGGAEDIITAVKKLGEGEDLGPFGLPSAAA